MIDFEIKELCKKIKHERTLRNKHWKKMNALQDELRFLLEQRKSIKPKEYTEVTQKPNKLNTLFPLDL